MPKKNLLIALLIAALATPLFAVNNGDTPVNTTASARRMIVDLTKTYGNDYKGGKEFMKRLDAIDAKLMTNAGDKDAQAALGKLITEASSTSQ